MNKHYIKHLVLIMQLDTILVNKLKNYQLQYILMLGMGKQYSFLLINRIHLYIIILKLSQYKQRNLVGKLHIFLIIHCKIRVHIYQKLRLGLKLNHILMHQFHHKLSKLLCQLRMTQVNKLKQLMQINKLKLYLNMGYMNKYSFH